MSHLKNRAISLSAPLRRLALAAAMSVLSTLAIANPPCPSDLDGSGEVDGGDMALLLMDWGGVCPEDPPSVTSVSPSSGPIEGGTTIVITGTSLSYTRGVKIGGVAATSFAVVNDNTVTAVTPAGAGGPAQVLVTTVLGNTAALAGGFIYTDVPKWCTVLEQSPNATVVTSAALRAAIVATGRPWRVQDKGTGIEMVLIPGGTFNMGCSPTDSNPGCGDGYPVHQVTLTAAFYMSRTEVTQSQWVTKMSSNPSYRQTEMNLPVECVSWNAAQTFCSLSGLRLATEAEWEYAYRAGTSTAFHDMPGYPNGTNSTSLLGTIAWYSNNSSNRTHPVAGKAANGFGLFDMSGNVWEWCQDWLGPYTSNAQINPTGPSTSTTYRVLRGGHYSDADCTASSRTHNYRPNDSSPLTGLRVARSP